VFSEQLPEFIGNHPLLALGFVGIGVALVANEMSRFTRGYKGISPAELTRLINREDALVIDVSAQNDFEKGHIVGSKHVAASQLEPDHKLVAKAKEQPVVIVCRTGVSGGNAAKKLVKAGFTKVHMLEGGIAAWQQAELPLTKGKH
jgi:rhodanese-related sulfurtransferase